MSSNDNYCRDLVIHGTANLYESFDSLFEQVEQWAREDNLTMTRDQVVEGLRQAVSEGYVQPYILSSHPPHSTPVPSFADRLGDLYFYVTAKGKQLVLQQETDADDEKATRRSSS